MLKKNKNILWSTYTALHGGLSSPKVSYSCIYLVVTRTAAFIPLLSAVMVQKKSCIPNLALTTGFTFPEVKGFLAWWQCVFDKLAIHLNSKKKYLLRELF